jgi:hypothetical protein
MLQMVSRVTAAVMAPDYGRQLTPGAVVDLDERLPGGGTLADHVRLEWFELMPDAASAPAKKIATKPAAPAMTEPGQEDRDG